MSTPSCMATSLCAQPSVVSESQGRMFPPHDDVQLRCLLFCKGDCECGMRCKDAQKPRWTSVGNPVSELSMVPPSLVEAASTLEPVFLVDIDSREVPRPLGTGDDWFVIPVRRTLTTSSSLPIRAKHALRDDSFVVTDALFKKTLTFAYMPPTLDAFASSKSAKCHRYFTIQDDAFRHSWSDEILWLAPPFHLTDDVVRKICDDKAAGILLHPLRRDERWFHDLQDVAVTWWDVPPRWVSSRPLVGWIFLHTQATLYASWCSMHQAMFSPCIPVVRHQRI